MYCNVRTFVLVFVVVGALPWPPRKKSVIETKMTEKDWSIALMLFDSDPAHSMKDELIARIGSVYSAEELVSCLGPLVQYGKTNTVVDAIVNRVSALIVNTKLDDQIVSEILEYSYRDSKNIFVGQLLEAFGKSATANSRKAFIDVYRKKPEWDPSYSEKLLKYFAPNVALNMDQEISVSNITDLLEWANEYDGSAEAQGLIDAIEHIFDCDNAAPLLALSIERTWTTAVKSRLQGGLFDSLIPCLEEHRVKGRHLGYLLMQIDAFELKVEFLSHVLKMIETSTSAENLVFILYFDPFETSDIVKIVFYAARLRVISLVVQSKKISTAVKIAGIVSSNKPLTKIQETRIIHLLNKYPILN
jgi:hypothetical protein